MFKKSKKKIVAYIMLLLALVLIGTITMIYGTTFYGLYQKDQKLLEDFTQSYTEEGHLNKKHIGEKPMDEKLKGIQSNVFYGVIFSEDGSIYKVVNDIKPIMEDSQLIDTAQTFLVSGKDTGMSKNLVYRVTRTDTQSFVFLLNNTIMKDSMTVLVRNTMLFGSLILIVLFVLSLKMADWIVAPLEESYKKQKQFISDAGHELKTPIATICANAEMLEREIGEDQWLLNIQFENKRMEQLVQQLLELTRTEKLALQLETIDISRIVLGGMLPFESVAFEKGYEIVSHIEEGVFIKGDGKLISQLTAILMDNALSHAEGKGNIEVALKQEGNMAVLAVSNPGKEIALVEREKLFERFYRGDEARKADGHYGLGLSIASNIVSAHHGRIWADWKSGKVTFSAAFPQKIK